MGGNQSCCKGLISLVKNYNVNGVTIQAVTQYLGNFGGVGVVYFDLQTGAVHLCWLKSSVSHVLQVFPFFLGYFETKKEKMRQNKGKTSKQQEKLLIPKCWLTAKHCFYEFSVC